MKEKHGKTLMNDEDSAKLKEFKSLWYEREADLTNSFLFHCHLTQKEWTEAKGGDAKSIKEAIRWSNSA